VVVGDPLAEGVTMGPSVDPGQFKTVLAISTSPGAKARRLVTGGKRTGADHGLFVEPTIYDGVRHTMRIAKERSSGRCSR
jgi:acyl-CoA reductase-like NAD-dependent aldehyde dehydrogenase